MRTGMCQGTDTSPLFWARYWRWTSWMGFATGDSKTVWTHIAILAPSLIYSMAFHTVESCLWRLTPLNIMAWRRPTSVHNRFIFIYFLFIHTAEHYKRHCALPFQRLTAQTVRSTVEPFMIRTAAQDCTLSHEIICCTYWALPQQGHNIFAAQMLYEIHLLMLFIYNALFQLLNTVPYVLMTVTKPCLKRYLQGNKFLWNIDCSAPVPKCQSVVNQMTLLQSLWSSCKVSHLLKCYGSRVTRRFRDTGGLQHIQDFISMWYTVRSLC